MFTSKQLASISLQTQKQCLEDVHPPSILQKQPQFLEDVRPPLVPQTPRQLLQKIRRLLCLPYPAPFTRILHVHDRYPHLQSTESYNLLIGLSIRHNVYGHTRRLLRQMQEKGLQPDADTERYVARYVVTKGGWRLAWRGAIRRYSSLSNIPLSLLIEILGFRLRLYALPQAFKEPLESARTPDLHPLWPVDTKRRYARVLRGMKARYNPPIAPFQVFEHLARLHPYQTEQLPLRVVYHTVKCLLRAEPPRENLAKRLTRKYIRQQNPELAPARVEALQGLVNLHLTVGEIRLSVFKRRRKLVHKFFKLHPQLRPNSKTAWLLLRFMARSRICGSEAYRFYQKYTRTWGPSVDSMDLRRKVIKFAIKQDRHDIAKTMSELPPLVHSRRWAKWTTPKRTDGLVPIFPWRLIYPQKGKIAKRSKSTFYKMLMRRRRWYRLQRKAERRTELEANTLKLAEVENQGAISHAEETQSLIEDEDDADESISEGSVFCPDNVWSLLHEAEAEAEDKESIYHAG